MGAQHYSTLRAEANKLKAKLLINAGAVVDAKDNEGYTPMSFTAVLGQDSIVELLLARGAQLESADRCSQANPWSATARSRLSIIVWEHRQRGCTTFKSGI